MSKASSSFLWKCEPEAEKLIENYVKEAIKQNSFIRDLSQSLLKITSTRLFDWLDHLVISSKDDVENRLLKAGFEPYHITLTYRIFHHPGAKLPGVVLQDDSSSSLGLAVSVESIANFLMTRGISSPIEGSPFSGYRSSLVSSENDVFFYVIERRGAVGIEPEILNQDHAVKYLRAEEKWLTRPRSLSDEEHAFNTTLTLAQEIIDELGMDMAAWIVLDGERRYWQARNLAGQIQKSRQDRLGMGWANHDHHTFRSSRKGFVYLVKLFEMLGFHCRERYWTGKEAGWGAQIMENPRARLVLFLDVDLAAEEINVDFAHKALPELPKLGTVGLWCALHGDSILKAGMHHLEAQFMFEELTHDLAHQGVGMMDPFSSFPYLKQAFTAGEIWHVDPAKVFCLLKEGKITQEQADKFLSYGAVGSHMENLQRREGYKGFNQKNVSVIIRKTDPRIIESDFILDRPNC